MVSALTTEYSVAQRQYNGCIMEYTLGQHTLYQDHVTASVCILQLALIYLQCTAAVTQSHIAGYFCLKNLFLPYLRSCMGEIFILQIFYPIVTGLHDTPSS